MQLIYKGISGLGRLTITGISFLGSCVILLCRAILGLFTLSFRRTDLIYQIVHLGWNSLLIVLLTVTFSGMVISLELAKEAVRYGVGYMVGGGVAIAMAREFGPMLTAIVLSGRIGSAITAELSTMKVTEQIDALEILGVDPVMFLMSTRLFANMLSIPLITLMSEVSGTWGGFIVAHIYAGISRQTYVDSIHMYLSAWDVWGGLIKSLVFALIITAVSGIMGFQAEREAYGVGRATTNSVVISIIMIFIANFFLSYILFK